MKFVCSQSDLNTNLSLVSRAVPNRPTHPVLGNVLLVANAQKQQVSLTGFDLSLGIYTSFYAEVTEGGTTTLPAKLLNDIVSRLSEGEITLEVGSEGEVVLATLTSASGRFQIRGMSAAEFPALPVLENGESLRLPLEALIEGLRGALFAASTDEMKQVLTGVHIISSQDSLEFAATDGHRLAVVETSFDSDFPRTTSDFSMTIPSRALRELERMLTAQVTDSIALSVDEGQVIFELGDQRLTSRKLEGAYPAYEQLIPRTFSRTVTVERKRLLSSLDLVAVLADQKNNLVKFKIDSNLGQLSLSVDAQDLGSAIAPINAEIKGDSTEIAFNVKYLMDGLKALSTTEIVMHLNEGNQPIIFTPLGGVKMTYLVMPVQIVR